MHVKPRNIGPAYLDDIRIHADGVTQTATYAYNDANELTSMTDYNGTQAFAYDAWGQQTSKTRGGHSAAYAYHYGGLLTGVTSDFPGERNAAYEYRGNKRRHSRTVGGTETVFNWGLGWDMLSEESGAGTLQRTYADRRGHVDGTAPSFGEYMYYTYDRLGSVRAVFDENKIHLSAVHYSPYGRIFAAEGSLSSRTGSLQVTIGSRTSVCTTRHSAIIVQTRRGGRRVTPWAW